MRMQFCRECALSVIFLRTLMRLYVRVCMREKRERKRNDRHRASRRRVYTSACQLVDDDKRNEW